MNHAVAETDNSLARVISEEEESRLQIFRTLVKGEKDLSCPMDDAYLLKFLRSKKGDPDRAFLALTNWWKARDRFSHAHDALYPSTCAHIFAKGFSITFANRDDQGRQIMLWRPGEWNPKETTFLELFRSNFPITDMIATRQQTQLHGAVYIVDLTGLSAAHVRACGPSSMKLLWNLTDSFPIRIKGIHFINHPAIFNIVYTCAKTFMKEKMKKRVHFHGYDYTSLHKFISPDILPKEYGGALNFKDFQELTFVQSMMDREEYFMELFNDHGYKTKLE